MSQASERELQPGQVIADRYRLEAPIGRGAMGAVWRAVQVRLESPVALEFPNAAIASDPDMLERFIREARSAAAVRSSHVVQIIQPSSSARWPASAPNELAPRTPTAEAVAAEELAPSSARRRLALAALPLLMLGLALAASTSSTPPEPEGRVARAHAPSAAVPASGPVPSGHAPSQPAPGLAPSSREASSAAASEPPLRVEAPASAVPHRAAPRGTARAPRPAPSSHRARKSAPTATTTARRASTSIDPYAGPLVIASSFCA